MIRLILRTLVGMAGLWLADRFINGVNITSNETLLIAALIMGVVNAVVRPVVFWLTLPVTFLTLGLFLFIVNAAMFGLTAWFLEGFSVDGLWAAVLGSIVMGIVNWIGQMVIGPREERGE
ncbi:MAG: phage holin family protein [Caulobacter sp.]|nr:phage holin family protein [Caulobacter sp.]